MNWELPVQYEDFIWSLSGNHTREPERVPVSEFVHEVTYTPGTFFRKKNNQDRWIYIRIVSLAEERVNYRGAPLERGYVCEYWEPWSPNRPLVIQEYKHSTLFHSYEQVESTQVPENFGAYDPTWSLVRPNVTYWGARMAPSSQRKYSPVKQKRKSGFADFQRRIDGKS